MTADIMRWASSCRAKIARADEHLNTLYTETDDWGNGDPLHLVRESNADGSEHIFRVYLSPEPDVWRWSLLMGDALHNLRCALDHIVYALALNHTGQDPPPNDSQLAFPICSDASFFSKPRVQSRISSLNEPARTGIERTQPYNRLKPGQWFAPLWWLGQLNDIDKHRLAHLVPLAAHPDDVAITADPGTFQALWNEGPLVHGTPLLRLILSRPDPNVQVDLDATAAVVLQFRGMRPFGVHSIMASIRKETVLVCRYLSRFFV